MALANAESPGKKAHHVIGGFCERVAATERCWYRRGSWRGRERDPRRPERRRKKKEEKQQPQERRRCQQRLNKRLVLRLLCPGTRCKAKSSGSRKFRFFNGYPPPARASPERLLRFGADFFSLPVSKCLPPPATPPCARSSRGGEKLDGRPELGLQNGGSQWLVSE